MPLAKRAPEFNKERLCTRDVRTGAGEDQATGVDHLAGRQARAASIGRFTEWPGPFPNRISQGSRCGPGSCVQWAAVFGRFQYKLWKKKKKSFTGVERSNGNFIPAGGGLHFGGAFTACG